MHSLEMTAAFTSSFSRQVSPLILLPHRLILASRQPPAPWRRRERQYQCLEVHVPARYSTIHSILFQKFRSLYEIWMRQMLPATQASSAWLRAITSWTDYKSPMTSLNSSVSTPVSCSPCVWPSTTTSPPRSASRTTRHRTAASRPPSLSAGTTSAHRVSKVCFSSLVLCEHEFVHHLASALHVHELQGRLSARTLRILLQHTHQA